MIYFSLASVVVSFACTCVVVKLIDVSECCNANVDEEQIARRISELEERHRNNNSSKTTMFSHMTEKERMSILEKVLSRKVRCTVRRTSSN